MSRLEAVRRSAELTATACAEVFGELLDAEGSFDGVDVQAASAAPWDALSFPLVCEGTRRYWSESIQDCRTQRFETSSITSVQM